MKSRRKFLKTCCFHVTRLLKVEMIHIQTDTKGQPYIEWVQAEVPGGRKRAWIQRRDGDKDWAQTPDGRYLNVVRVDETPSGSPTDFPIFSELPDEQILVAFVAAVCAITGCRFP